MVGGQTQLFFFWRGETVLLRLEATLPEAGFEGSWVGVGSLWDRVSSGGDHVREPSEAPVGPGVEQRVVPPMEPAPLNVPSRSTGKWGGADESSAWCYPQFLSVPTAGSEMAMCKVGFIWGPPISHPAHR